MPKLRSYVPFVALSSDKLQRLALSFQAGYVKVRRLNVILCQIKEQKSYKKMQKHSGSVSCLHGKRPNTMKLNALEGAKMLLLHRRAHGVGHPSTSAGQAV